MIIMAEFVYCDVSWCVVYSVRFPYQKEWVCTGWRVASYYRVLYSNHSFQQVCILVEKIDRNCSRDNSSSKLNKGSWWLLCAVCTLLEREIRGTGVESGVCMVCTAIQFISLARRIKKITSLSLAPLPFGTIRPWTSRVTFYLCIYNSHWSIIFPWFPITYYSRLLSILYVLYCWCAFST